MTKKIPVLAVLFSFCLLGFANASSDEWCYSFKKDLRVGSRGDDVAALRTALIKEGVYKTDWKSTTFDSYMDVAVKDFQNKYAPDILIPNDITTPTGIFGKTTRAKINSIYGCKDGVLNSKPIIEIVATDKNAIANKAIEYINKYLAQGVTVSLGKIENSTYSFYKFEAMSNGSPITVYALTDGSKIIFQEVDITKEPANAQINTSAPAAEIKKTDKPLVDLFVMSHCPYSAQIEKGIIPTIEALGDKIDFNLKFCSYAMHGEEELKEQTNQYCIQKEQKDKLLPYLKCFLKEGKGEECLNTVQINKDKLNLCVESTEKEFNTISNFKNQKEYFGNFPSFNIFKADNEKYGVQGSPTLIINGVQVQSNRDSDSLLKTICSAFSIAPETCTKNISSETPSAGFGTGTTSVSTTNGCGN
ncbi:hypothetical protein M0R01_00050 [bacterium]|nr:hypothetical protein [bacterium]